MSITAKGQITNSEYAFFADILRSELCKLSTVRSTYWSLLAAVVFQVGLAIVIAIVLPEHLTADFDASRVALGGLHLSQIAVGVLGVLVITSEYDTGMIRTTFTAVPRRRLVLAAKALVFVAVALIVGVLASFASYFAFLEFVSDDSMRTSITEPGIVRAVSGGGLYLAVLGLLGLGLGAIIRSSAGAIAALFSILFVPSLILQSLPRSWQDTVGPYIPAEAGRQIFSLRHDGGALGVWTGFGVFCLYAVLAMAVAFILIERRDA